MLPVHRNGGWRMIKKTFEVDYSEGEGLDRIEIKGKVVMKRLNWDEYCSLEQESTDIRLYGQTSQVTLNSKKMKQLAVLKSTVESQITKTTYYEDKVSKAILALPVHYDLDINGIMNLPREIGEQLFEAFTELNGMPDKKKEALPTT